ncbi:hypothetical protein HanXRQr2_Chr06g0262851 [Helianthus annuus]|uniref:Uncharacterized protein n=2 Tax=Helianthus annuus TaxID=4232 RepID=A0A9K3NKC1_HELAN|nr:hypothetical protein HanXRQr2_Chr06g0262851 [Helianthus annuus]KAJ0573848.1 hypothetical protein HanHA89_Chr06g0231391 [Helianthus annuus]KAJ0738183.1 hypothetical protein HanLR1_Chr06g0215321 [Helianthus annuus]KAJ0915751.1 hypothetical protein HanPSC8_Chr06g0253511 [Helianthus annuus]
MRPSCTCYFKEEVYVGSAHLEILGVIWCMWGVHTSLGVIRKARLGEMFRWSPYLLWIPKSKPISQLYWPTNLLLLYLYTWGMLGILGWYWLYWINSWQLVIYFRNRTYVDNTMMYLDLDFLFRLGAKNYLHQRK